MRAATESASTSGARITYFNAYRVAAVVLALYFAGHTFGAVLNTPAFGPESDHVVSAMKSVHLSAEGSLVTWYGFYRGFGAFVSVFFVLSMVLSWFLGTLPAGRRCELSVISWSLLASHAAGTAIAFTWFFPIPIVFSSTVTLLLAAGCIGDLFASSRVKI